MRSTALAATLMLAPAVAVADPGHWAAAGGHDHWIALGALAVAGLIGLAALARGRKARAEPQDEDEGEGSEA